MQSEFGMQYIRIVRYDENYICLQRMQPTNERTENE